MGFQDSAFLTFVWRRVGQRLRCIVLECVIPVNHLLSLHFSSAYFLCVPERRLSRTAFFLELSFGSRHFFQMQ